ncbi:MAG TPA: HEAT repeat domain-containing protein, partial [Labilithrix sp.]|nr:HEAT repeat domain-containing protein [Labilithrix sp.]
MGLFDFFKSNQNTGDKKKSGAAAKWAEPVGSKRAQAYDRQEAIQELSKLGTAEAAEALLKRFTFNTDPSITDQEEKELAFAGILKAGKDAIEPVRAFAAKAESLRWPMRILRETLEEEELVDELIIWLSKWDTEYAKFTDPKLQLLEELGDHVHPQILAAVEPFLQDVNEP